MIAVPEAPGTVAIAGDWHGNLRWALDRIEDAHAADATTIVNLGDVGYCVPDPATRMYLFRVDKRLGELGKVTAVRQRQLILVAADGAALRPAPSTD